MKLDVFSNNNSKKQNIVCNKDELQENYGEMTVDDPFLHLVGNSHRIES